MLMAMYDNPKTMRREYYQRIGTAPTKLVYSQTIEEYLRETHPHRVVAWAPFDYVGELSALPKELRP